MELTSKQPLGKAGLYPDRFERLGLISEVVEGLEPALGIEPRTC